MQPDTLYIEPSRSVCGSCGFDADPSAQSHSRKLGYNPGEGCNAKWTKVSSNYFDFEGLYDRIRKMRPDLEFVDQFGKA